MKPIFSPSARRGLFWLLLAGFVAWDIGHSAPISVWREPPLLAPGSGQAAAGGHCALPR
jgi:hypothetical protein